MREIQDSISAAMQTIDAKKKIAKTIINGVDECTKIESHIEYL